MIYFNIELQNPWSSVWKRIKNFNGAAPWPHKFWEFEILRTNDLIKLALDVTVNQDHAGFRAAVALAGYYIEFNLYDSRHWDEENKTWQ